ncbi:MAG TPA: ClC family H(+)/Cl(-) exchange transporter, partial [Treponemataceae bacterium]|nr:ClC family H(+)/Cl(-) exchange transporter [Treponemataceae bacterium]
RGQFMDSETTAHTIRRWYSFKLKVIFEGICIGILTGLLIVAYRLALEKAFIFLTFMYQKVSEKPLALLPWIIALIVIGIIISFLVKWAPLISGSGIPQVEGFLSGKLDMCWWKVLIAKFAGGVLSIGSGLSLGREGPSVQLGATVGLGFSRTFKRSHIEESYLVTAGASAGLAAAFNAPLAGVLFSLEEVHKNFSPLVLLTALSSALTSSYVAGEFFGLGPIFTFSGLEHLPLNHYALVILLGLFLGVCGVVFNAGLLKSQTLYAHLKWIPSHFRVFIPLSFSLGLGFILPQLLGGGHELIVEVVSFPLSLGFLTLLLVGKFVFTMICYGSGAPGGIFLPLLSIGAVIGTLWGTALSTFFGIDPSFTLNFIVLAMAGFFTAIVRAPITGIILISEMTGSFEHFLSLAVVCIVAYIVADLLGSKPVYDSLLERLLKSYGERKKNKNDSRKTILEFVVQSGSKLDGAYVRDISWPSLCLLVSLRRGQNEILPKGNTKIRAGDYLVILTDASEVSTVHEYIIPMIDTPIRG